MLFAIFYDGKIWEGEGHIIKMLGNFWIIKYLSDHKSHAFPQVIFSGEDATVFLQYSLHCPFQ